MSLGFTALTKSPAAVSSRARGVVSASAFHDNPGIAVKPFDVFNQCLDMAGEMWDFKWSGNQFHTQTEDSYHAFAFGNVNTYSIHVYNDVTPFLICNGMHQFYSLPIPSTVV